MTTQIYDNYDTFNSDHASEMTSSSSALTPRATYDDDFIVTSLMKQSNSTSTSGTGFTTDSSSNVSTSASSLTDNSKKSYCIRDGKMVGIKIKRSEYVQITNGHFAPNVSTVVFNYLPVCKEIRKIDNHGIWKSNDKKYRLRFKVSKHVWEYNCTKNALLFAGIHRISSGMDFNLLWGRHLNVDELKRLKKGQRVLHFPGTSEIGRKDKLARNMSRMLRVYGKEFNYFPKTYVLPHEAALLSLTMASISRSKQKKHLYLTKPYSGSCGRGIKLISDLYQIDRTSHCIIQKYLTRPMLINGRKFDLRIYVLVTSYNPLIIYTFDDGLVRFSTKKFSLSSRKYRDRQIHLTNYSVQKKYSEYSSHSDDSTNSFVHTKWSLKELWNYLSNKPKYHVDMIKERINDVIIRTILACEPTTVSRLNQANVEWNQCFELFGFDILLDADAKPWLLEVNLLPSLSSSSPLDKRIKTTLMCDVFHCVGIEPIDFKRKSDRSNRIPHSRTQPPSIHTSKQIAELIKRNQLCATDKKLLGQICDQFRRCGHLDRIFPLSVNIDSYEHLFEVRRYRNLLLWTFLRMANAQQQKFFESHE